MKPTAAFALKHTVVLNLAAFVCSLSPGARAEPVNWTGGAGDGSWHSPGNWDVNRLPGISDDVTIGLEGDYVVALTSHAHVRSLTLGAAAGTQTLLINTVRFDLVTGGAVLSNGVVEMRHPGAEFWIHTPATGYGELANAGRINIGMPGGPAGDRALLCELNNQGVVTLHDGANLGLRANATNSGEIHALGGNLSISNNGVVAFTNTGTVAIAPGRTYSHGPGTLNLQAGTFAGPGAALSLNNVTVNLSEDFHSGDWGSVSVLLGRFNGPGAFINDLTAGIWMRDATIATLFDNRTLVSAHGCVFSSGLLNPDGAVLRVIGNDNYTQSIISNSFTNAGTIELINRGIELVVNGTLTNTGRIDARREGSPANGARVLAPTELDNHGTITIHDVDDLRLGQGNLGCTVRNYGTINLLGGDLSNWDGMNSPSTLAFFNTGTVAFAPGRRYIHRLGSLNLTSGTFGGPGAVLRLAEMVVRHPADFHTADWASIYSSAVIFDGPGTFVNDHPAGFTGDATNGAPTRFHTLVDNRSTFTSNGCYATAGFLNPLGSTLRIRYNTISFLETRFATNFRNAGVVELVDPGVSFTTIGPGPDNLMRTIFNEATGRIEVGLPGGAPGVRRLKCDLYNYGTVTLTGATLELGEGNYQHSVFNYGTFDMSGGDLSFPTSPFNTVAIANTGEWILGNADRTITGMNGPFINNEGGVLSGSVTIWGPTPGTSQYPRLSNSGGTIRPGGLGAAGTVSVMGYFTQNAAGRIEIDIGGTTPGIGHDRIYVDQEATREGVLVANSINCFAPADATEFSVFRAASGATGEFEFASAHYSADQTSEFVVLTAGECSLPACPIVVTAATPQAYLDGLAGAPDGLLMEGACGRETLVLPALSSAGGTVRVASNGDLRTLLASTLAVVSGGLSIRDNPVLESVSLPQTTHVGGDFHLIGNAAATTIDLEMLASVGGEVRITDNPTATDIHFPGLTGVAGDFTLETQNQPDVELGGVHVAGSVDVSCVEAESVGIAAPGGTTSIRMCNGAVCVNVDLPDDATPPGTLLDVLLVGDSRLDPAPGLDAVGQPATIDHIGAYAFELDAPLGGAASLVFELSIPLLEPAEREAVLAALGEERLSLAVQSDDPLSLPQARALCGPADPLLADGCARLTAFDASGVPLLPGTSEGAAAVRIEALVSHFSIYGIAIVGTICPADFNQDGGIDGADVEAFFAAWENGDATSDVNQDGGVDGADVETFFAAWEAGGC